MKFSICWDLIKKDYNRLSIRYEKNFLWMLPHLILSPSFNITFWLRICTYLNSKKNVIAYILLIPSKLIYIFMQRNTGIQIPIGTDIGGGINFTHFSCIVFASDVIIGENCTIHQGVTLGRTTGINKMGCPKIGNNVIIYPGAVVIGNIRIGNNVIIGANSVVMTDVNDNNIVAGIPAKVISLNSNGIIINEWKKWFNI